MPLKGIDVHIAYGLCNLIDFQTKLYNCCFFPFSPYQMLISFPIGIMQCDWIITYPKQSTHTRTHKTLLHKSTWDFFLMYTLPHRGKNETQVSHVRSLWQLFPLIILLPGFLKSLRLPFARAIGTNLMARNVIQWKRATRISHFIIDKKWNLILKKKKLKVLLVISQKKIHVSTGRTLIPHQLCSEQFVFIFFFLSCFSYFLFELLQLPMKRVIIKQSFFSPILTKSKWCKHLQRKNNVRFIIINKNLMSNMSVSLNWVIEMPCFNPCFNSYFYQNVAKSYEQLFFSRPTLSWRCFFSFFKQHQNVRCITFFFSSQFFITDYEAVALCHQK